MKVIYTKTFEVNAGDSFESVMRNCEDTDTVHILEADGDTIRYQTWNGNHTKSLVDFLLEFGDEIPGDATVFTGE